MQINLKGALIAATVLLSSQSHPAFALNNNFGSTGHAHGHFAGHNLLFPYVCDADSDEDMTSQYINDHGHFTLRVNVFEVEGTFACANAGSVADLAHPVAFQSASALVATAGGLPSANVYLELISDGEVFFFSTTAATQGPTRGSYTLYTWTRNQLQLPSGSVSSVGIGVNANNTGTAFVQSFALNGHELVKAFPVLSECPWNGDLTCFK